MLEDNNIQPGTSWRFLVHDDDDVQKSSDKPYHVTSHPQEYSDLVLPDTVFDELVVDKWLHVEQMDDDLWWMDVGGVVIWVTVGENGQPRVVRVVHPDEHAGPTPGCYYDINGVMIGEYPEGLSSEEEDSF